MGVLTNHEAMKIKLLPAILLLLTTSCATLDMTGLQQGSREPFEALRLNPSLEATELRIDIIRNQESYQVNDSVEETINTPYHPVGFDLGNGMFFDLEGNLSFRLEDLLQLRGKPCYSLSQTSRKKQRRADQIFTFCNGELTVKYPPGHREHDVLRMEFRGNSTEIFYRNHLTYGVDFYEDKIVYRGKRRKWDTMHKSDDQHYYRKRLFWREDYQLKNDRLYLGRNLIIGLDDQNRKIRVMRQGLFSTRTMLTIEKSGNHLYLIEKRNRGKRIEFTESGLKVYQNRYLLSGWQAEKR